MCYTTVSRLHEPTAHPYFNFECLNRSEVDIGRTLLRFAASPTPTLGAFLQLSDPYTNYFYESLHNTHGIGLIVPDVPELREEAARLDLSHLVYFGYNGDPVTLCSLDDVYTKLTKKEDEELELQAAEDSSHSLHVRI
tara:strand:- start:86 stop:499 length:414 start_codon:yes stop_codon:yes gene_type:complete